MVFKIRLKLGTNLRAFTRRSAPVFERISSVTCWQFAQNMARRTQHVSCSPPCVLLCVTVRYCVLLCVACVTVCNCAIIRAVPWSLHRQSLLNMLPATLCLGSPQTYCRLFCSATLSHCVCIYRRSETALSNYLQTLQGPRRPSDAEDSSVGVQLFVTHLIPPSWRN